jgi:hypothetical protein
MAERVNLTVNRPEITITKIHFNDSGDDDPASGLKKQKN